MTNTQKESEKQTINNTVTFTVKEGLESIIRNLEKAVAALNNGKFGDKHTAIQYINLACGAAHIMQERV